MTTQHTAIVYHDKHGEADVMNANALPARSFDTMSEAIALSSPSGRMSKRAREAANKRLSIALFGQNGLQAPARPQTSKKEQMLAHAKRLRELAARGMSPRKFIKDAEMLEAKAEAL